MILKIYLSHDKSYNLTSFTVDDLMATVSGSNLSGEDENTNEETIEENQNQRFEVRDHFLFYFVKFF